MSHNLWRIFEIYPSQDIWENHTSVLNIHFAKFYGTCALNPQAPVAQKISDEVVFRRFQGEGVEFFKSNLTDPPPSDF